MKHIKSALAMIIAGFCVYTGQAGQTATLVKNRSGYNDPVVPGKWHCNFKKAKKFAEDNKLPFICVWSNGDACGHCVMFESSCNSSVFKNWMTSSGMVFYFVSSEDKKLADGAGKVESSVFHWARKKKNTSYPFVRIYWPAGPGNGVDVATIGDTMDKQKTGKTGGELVVKYLKDKLKAFKPPQSGYKGGSFEVAPTALEAELGNTTAVDFSLVRTNSYAITSVSTNTVLVTYPSGMVETNLIAWAKDDVSTNLTVTISEEMGLTNVNQQVSLILLNEKGKAIATNFVTMVKEPENSPTNPRWIGETTKDRGVITSETLKWGEWTMDIDAATNKVRTANAAKSASRAYTLVLLEGALWCPDCVNTDENLFNQPEFKKWATDNNVALVAIDLPRGSTTDARTASLLTDEVGGSYNASGTSYLSRKMVNRALGDEILTRNWDIAAAFRLPNWSNPIRPPVPSIFILRDNGTVAARLQYFGGVESPTAFDPAFITRLDEMLAQVALTDEESNDNPTWTQAMVGERDAAESTLSFTDGADVYRLDPDVTLGKRIAVSLGSAQADGETRLQADILTVANGAEKVIASSAAVVGKTAERIFSADINSTNCYLRIKGLTDEKGHPLDAQFALSNKNSTVFSYSVKTDFVVLPTDVVQKIKVIGEQAIMVDLVSNQVYRIAGLADGATENAAVLQPLEEGENLYLALADGEYKLTLAGVEAEVQKWSPGTVGFAVPSASVAESAGSYTIRLVRTGGVSGRVTAKVAFDKTRSATDDELVEFPADFEDELVWEEGDATERELLVTVIDNPYADGNLELFFTAEVGGDGEAGQTQLKLTLRDNDKKVPGRIAVTGTMPAMAKAMVAFARVGSGLTIELARVDGADGVQDVTLTTTGGTLDKEAFTWNNREVTSQSANLTLPESGKQVKVTMKPAKGSYVDSDRRVLTVNLLPKDVPGFETDAASVAATRYVPIEPLTVAVDPTYVTDPAKIKVTKYSGTLAAGLKWRYDAEKGLVIEGVPTKAGTTKAVYRVSEGSKAGLTVAVTVTVTDPVITGGGATGTAPLNAAVKTSRTFSAVPVYDRTTQELIGLLTLTVPRTGKLSAKYATVDAAKTASFSCKNWASIGADGELGADLAGKVGTEAATLQVTAAADGTVLATLDYPQRAGDELEVDIPNDNLWSKKNPATDFKGYYTVQLPVSETKAGTPFATGCGYVTLKMNTTTAINAGKFAYAGVLPNGKPFSGSSIIAAKDWLDDPDFLYWKRGVLPILSVSETDCLAGALTVNPGAADPAANDYDEATGLSTGRCYYKNIRCTVWAAEETDGFIWTHVEKAVEDAGVQMKLGAIGTYYDAKEDFLSCCKNALGSGALKLFALEGLNVAGEEILEQTNAGLWNMATTNVIAGVNVTFAKASKSAKTKTSAVKTADSKKLSLTFTLSTGIVKGSFKLPMESGSVAFTFEGVVLPGFGYGDCAACGISVRQGGSVSAEHPFIAGTAWMNDKLEYTDAKGKNRTLTLRRSTPFSVGVNAGN